MGNKFFQFDRSGQLSLGILLVWVVAVSVPLTYLVAVHALPLPVRPAAPLATEGKPGEGRWQAVHILVADCPCSKLVGNYLAARGANGGLDEQVWMIGGTADWEASLKKSGFSVQHRDAEAVAAQLGIEGGPWLRLISPAGAVVYSGGYAAQRPRGAKDVCDLALWRAAVRGETLKTYPSFGCAASTWLQKTMDPLGLTRRPANKKSL